MTVEVELGPKIGYEVNKQLFSACLHRGLLGFVTQHSVDIVDETLNLVHRTSPLADFVSHHARHDNDPRQDYDDR